MSAVITALSKALANFRQSWVWGLIFAPFLLALLVWIALLLSFLEPIRMMLLSFPPLSWMRDTGWVWLPNFLAMSGSGMIALGIAYLVSMLSATFFVLPFLLKRLVRQDYADLAACGSEPWLIGVFRSVWVTFCFVLGWILTLPLLLFPLLGWFVPLFWMVWLMRRMLVDDVLALHATETEKLEIRRRHAGPCLALAVAMSVLAYIPVVGLLTPVLAALAYIHYCLAALRVLRERPNVAQEGEAT